MPPKVLERGSKRQLPTALTYSLIHLTGCLLFTLSPLYSPSLFPGIDKLLAFKCLSQRQSEFSVANTRNRLSVFGILGNAGGNLARNQPESRGGDLESGQEQCSQTHSPHGSRLPGRKPEPSLRVRNILLSNSWVGERVTG